MKKYIYGIDIGGTTIKIGLFDIEHKLLKKWEIKTNTKNNGTTILTDLVKTIRKETPNLEEVVGYGIGVPGPVIKNYISLAVNLGLKDINLQEALKVPLENDHIYVANDANTAALGEAIYGAGLGKKDVVMMTLGTGVGSGIVSEGKLIEGAHGSGGEIGHLMVDFDLKLPCNCGKQGCLETVASATGIRNVYYKMKETYKGYSPLYELQLPSAKAIIDAAKKGDELALEVFEYATNYLGYACSVLAVTSNPETIVIGGGVSKAGDFLIDKIKSQSKKYLFTPTQKTNIVAAKLGNDAGMYGAMQMVVNRG